MENSVVSSLSGTSHPTILGNFRCEDQQEGVQVQEGVQAYLAN